MTFEYKLQPDITAPGVDILAAWSEATTVTGVINDKRIVPYNIISGTSMPCPHATAVAAYDKSFHPTWSPSAIKSALMTTGTNTIFAVGESYIWLLINQYLSLFCYSMANES